LNSKRNTISGVTLSWTQPSKSVGLYRKERTGSFSNLRFR
jgi:hypothetical protein